jgi:hypothetical protein
MILSNVNIGTGPSSGDGDPLRTAFIAINNNFQIVKNNVNALTNSVTSVAGRNGNVILTVNDIIGAASVAYVNSQLGNVSGYSNINVTAFLPSYAGSIATVTAANLAMKGYVDASIAGLVDSAPGTLDTLNELAAALGDDPNLSVTLTNTINSANTTMKAYVDGQITAANSAVTTANVGIIGYVNQANTIQSAQVNAANLAIVAANLGMKGYVDSVATLSSYGNANVASYLPGYAGNITVNTIKFDNLSEQTTAYTGTQWRSNLSSNVRVKPSWLSYVPGGKNLEGTQYGFDSGGMFFSGNADNDFAYPIQYGLHFHEQDVLEVIATLYFGATNNDHGLSIFSADTRPIWRSSTDGSRIAFQFDVGIPVLYGQTTANTAPGSPILSPGNYYTVKFTYDPTNTVTVETFSGNTASGSPLDSRSISEVLPAGDYKVGFDADNDASGVKSYWTNLVVRTLTNTVVNDLEVQGQVTGNLIPGANVAYSLGSITNQWKDLFVSNNTIFIGGVPLSIDAGGTLLVDGVQVSSIATGITSNSTITITNAGSGSNSPDINLNSADDITLQAKDRLTGSDIEGGDINIYAGDGSSDDDTSGDTSGGGDIQIYGGAGGAAGLSATAGAGGYSRLYGGNGGSGSATRTSGDGGDVSIQAGDAGANVGGGGADGGTITISAGDSTGNTIDGGDITLTTGMGSTNALAGSVGITIPSSDLGSGGTWTFDGYGNLTVPGSIIPTANVTYSLGNVTNRWKDLYLSGNTIFLGDATITTESGRLVTTGAAISPPTGAVGFANVTGEVTTNFSTISSYFTSFGYTANLRNYTSAPIVWDEIRSVKFNLGHVGTAETFGYTVVLDERSGGRFANAIATLDTTGNIASIVITDGGSGYDSYYSFYATDPTGYTDNSAGQNLSAGPPLGISYRRIGLIPTTASDVGNITSIGSFSRYDGCPTVGSNSYTWTGNTGTTISFTVDWSSNTVTSYTYTPALPALTSANDWQNWLLDYQNTNDYGWYIGSGSSEGLGALASSAIYDYLSREALPNSLTYDLSNTTWYPNNLLVNNSSSVATLSSQTLFVTFNRTAIGYATVENSYGNPVYWSRGLSADTGISSGGDMTVAGDLRVTGDLYVSPTSIYMGDLQISAADGNLKVNTGFKFSDNSVQSTAYSNVQVATYLTANPPAGSYGNVQVATYLPTHTGNVRAGNVFAVTAYRFANGLVSITNDDSHVALFPDNNANPTAGVKVGGGGYILGPNSARNITLNYGSASGVVGLQANVVIGTGGSGNLTVFGRVTAGNITANYISGDGSAITSLSGAQVSGNVAETSLAYSVNISPVILNQEYHVAILPAKEGAYGVKAADGTANVTYNPVQNRLTVNSISAGNVSAGNVFASGTSGKIGFTNGGFVQQITANSNGVSLNTVTGNIQLMGINLGVNGIHTVSFTNNKLEETDLILVSHHSGGVSNFAVGAYYAAPSTAIIWIRNITGADTSTVTPMLKFALIKAPGS